MARKRRRGGVGGAGGSVGGGGDYSGGDRPISRDLYDDPRATPDFLDMEAQNTYGVGGPTVDRPFQKVTSLSLSRGTPRVPGKGSGDTVPSMLTPGEAVLTKPAAELLGRDTIDRLNALAAMTGGGEPQGYARGTSRVRKEDTGAQALVKKFERAQGFADGTSSVGGGDKNAQMQQMIHQIAMQHGGRPPVQGFADGTPDVQPQPQPQMDPNERIKQLVHQIAIAHGGTPPDAMAQAQGGAPAAPGAPPQPQSGPAQPAQPTGGAPQQTQGTQPPAPAQGPAPKQQSAGGAPPAAQQQPKQGLGSYLMSNLGVGSAEAAPRYSPESYARNAPAMILERQKAADRGDQEGVKGINERSLQFEKHKGDMDRDLEKQQRAPDTPEAAKQRGLQTIYNNYGAAVGLKAEKVMMLRDAIANEKDSDKKLTLMDKLEEAVTELDGHPAPNVRTPPESGMIGSAISGVKGMFGGGGQQDSAAPQRDAPPPEALEYLKANPGTKAQFEQKYGPIQ